MSTVAVSASAVDPMHVIEGVSLGTALLNVTDEQLITNVRNSIRRQHTQARPQMLQGDRICLLGGGPSLNDTLPELIDLLAAGAKLVTTNGAYHWALNHGLFPQTQIVMDARADNARFLEPALPRCHYALASTCHPACWDAVEGRDHVWIWHPFTRHDPETDPCVPILDEYYARCWEPISGGTTVVTRAMFLLRTLGYARMDLFGVDSCWMGGQHHAFDQPENAKDKRFRVRFAPSDDETRARDFDCSVWHLKQFEDFLRIVRVHGHAFLLNVHGDGLLAHALRVGSDMASASVTELA